MGIFLARCGLPAGDGVVIRYGFRPSAAMGRVSALRDADSCGDSGRVVGVSLFVPAADLHHHRWMQLHISSRVRSSSSTELRQVIRRSGCCLIYRLHGVGLNVVENLFTLSCLTRTSSHILIGVSAPSPQCMFLRSLSVLGVYPACPHCPGHHDIIPLNFELLFNSAGLLLVVL